MAKNFYNNPFDESTKLMKLGTVTNKMICSLTIEYYYDGCRVLSETDEEGDLLRSYTYGNYLDETLILTDSTGASDVDYYYAHNHLYSPVALINASGDLPLMYYKNRLYCPNTGRFLQRDPLDYVDGTNLYEYVNNNSFVRVDAFGLSWNTIDFINHYFGDLAPLYPPGATVDLGSSDVDLLSTFRSAPGVTAKVKEFRNKVHNIARNVRRTKLHCLHKIEFIAGSDTAITDVTKQIFAVGHSTFYRNYFCAVKLYCCGQDVEGWEYYCFLGFSIKDKFKDPLDIGIEIPGGTTYPIIAGWYEDMSYWTME